MGSRPLAGAKEPDVGPPPLVRSHEASVEAQGHPREGTDLHEGPRQRVLRLVISRGILRDRRVIALAFLPGESGVAGSSGATSGYCWVCAGLTIVFIIGPLVDYLVPFSNPNKQTVHDMAAKTIVVKA